jgi:hypothetical protein
MVDRGAGGHPFDLLEDSVVGFADVVSLRVESLSGEGLVSRDLCQALEVQAGVGMVVLEAISLMKNTVTHHILRRITIRNHHKIPTHRAATSRLQIAIPFKPRLLLQITHHKLLS